MSWDIGAQWQHEPEIANAARTCEQEHVKSEGLPQQFPDKPARPSRKGLKTPAFTGLFRHSCW